jgi:hypothetical protein
VFFGGISSGTDGQHDGQEKNSFHGRVPPIVHYTAENAAMALARKSSPSPESKRRTASTTTPKLGGRLRFPAIAENTEKVVAYLRSLKGRTR